MQETEEVSRSSQEESKTSRLLQEGREASQSLQEGYEASQLLQEGCKASQALQEGSEAFRALQEEDEVSQASQLGGASGGHNIAPQPDQPPLSNNELSYGPVVDIIKRFQEVEEVSWASLSGGDS